MAFSSAAAAIFSAAAWLSAARSGRAGRGRRRLAHGRLPDPLVLATGAAAAVDGGAMTDTFTQQQ